MEEGVQARRERGRQIRLALILRRDGEAKLVAELIEPKLSRKAASEM